MRQYCSCEWNEKGSVLSLCAAHQSFEAKRCAGFERDAQAVVADERKWYDAQLVAIKHELNGMALIGVKPMWGSLLSRLEQLIADAKARHQ